MASEVIPPWRSMPRGRDGVLQRRVRRHTRRRLRIEARMRRLIGRHRRDQRGKLGVQHRLAARRDAAHLIARAGVPVLHGNLVRRSQKIDQQVVAALHEPEVFVGGGRCREGNRPRRRTVGPGIVEFVGGSKSRAEVISVRAGAAVEGVVSGSGNQRIVARTGFKGIRSRACVENVAIAASRRQRICTGTGIEHVARATSRCKRIRPRSRDQRLARFIVAGQRYIGADSGRANLRNSARRLAAQIVGSGVRHIERRAVAVDGRESGELGIRQRHALP